MADILIPKKRGRPKGPTKVVYHRRVAPELVKALDSVIELHKKAVPCVTNIMEAAKSAPSVLSVDCIDQVKPLRDRAWRLNRAPVFRPNGKL